MEAEVLELDVSTDRVALYNPIEAGLSGLEDKYKDGPKDLSIPANYEACRMALSETRGVRGKTEKLRKELKADALAYGRLVDSTAKRIIDKVLEIETPYAEAKKAYDTKVEIEKREKALAEERRIDGIASRIASIGALVAAHVSSSSQYISDLIPVLQSDLDRSDDWAMEFSEKAKGVINDTMAKLKELQAMKLQQERAEADRIQREKEAAEKAEADRIQREKEAAAERERLAKEREELEKERAAMQAERDRMAAEQAERDRVAKEKQAELERAAKSLQEEKDRAAKAAQEEKDRIAREEQEEKDRIAREEQAEKDRAAKAERERLQAEVEALKKERDPVAQVGPLPAQEAPTEPGKLITSTGDITDDYKAAGRAIMAITGSKPIAKAVLDAIIQGSIPHITYTGAVQS